MNGLTSASAIDELPAVKSGVEAEISNSPDQERLKLSPLQIDDDVHGIRSSLARLTSNSLDELGGLISELQEVRDFLRSEGERVQREMTNYAHLNQSALAAIKIITETVAPWKSSAVDAQAQNSLARLLASRLDFETFLLNAANEINGNDSAGTAEDRGPGVQLHRLADRQKAAPRN